MVGNSWMFNKRGPRLEPCRSGAYLIEETRTAQREHYAQSHPEFLRHHPHALDQPKKIDAILPFQLEDAIPFDLEDVVFDYQVLETSPDGNSRILCVYMRTRELAELLAALAQYDIDPKRVSLGPLSLFNLYDHLIGEENLSGVAILDLGHNHSELTIFDQGRPQVIREISGGGSDITDAIADAFKVGRAESEQGKIERGAVGVQNSALGDEQEDLMVQTCEKALQPIMTEVQRSIGSYELKNQASIQRIYLTGGSSQLNGVAAYLSRHIGIPVQDLEPADASFVRLSNREPAVGAYMTKSMALSVQAFARQHRSQVNLRQGDFIYTGDFGFLRGRIISVTLALVLMFVMGALVAVSKKRVLEAENARLKGEVAKLSQEITGEENDDIQFLVATVNSEEEEVGKEIPQHSALFYLARISELIGPEIEVELDKAHIDVEKKRIVLKGKTSTASDVDVIADALRADKCFRKAKSEGTKKSMDDKAKFKLNIPLSCG